MFDLAMALSLVACVIRSLRLRFPIGAACALAALATLFAATASAIQSGLLRGQFGIAMGAFFIGPSAVNHPSPIPGVGVPTVTGVISGLLTGIPAWRAGRRAAGAAYGDASRAWGSVQLAFLAAFTFGAIRLVTALAFSALEGGV
jgi:hypothetical protein